MTVILTPPNEILVTPTIDVDPTMPGSLQIAGEMLQVLADLPHAAAVAAPQIGSTARGMAYRDKADGPTVLWNAQIVSRSRATTTGWEGCLSFPDSRFLVERPRSVTVEGLDVIGDPVRVTAHGFQARMFCHEVDHLEGRLVDAIAQDVRRRT